MKKVLLSLLMVAFLMPFALKAQSNVERTIVTIDTAACDTLIWNGNAYTTDTAFLQIESDTMYVLNITINHSYNTTRAISANCSYTFGRKTYTKDTTVVDTLAAIGGCDSIVALTLTFTHTDTLRVSDTTVCEYYVWNGNWSRDLRKITENGTFTRTDTVANCNITGIFNMNILTPSQKDTLVISSVKDSLRCGRYKLNGVTYTETSTIYDTAMFRTADRCLDSIVGLYLEIFPKYQGDTTIRSCGITTFEGRTYYHDTVATIKLGETIHKCDSSVTLHLSILPTPVIQSIEGNYMIAPNETSTLSAQVTIAPAGFGAQNIAYKWSFNGQTSTADSVVIPSVTENTDVTLNVSLANGCSDTRTITIVPYDASGIDAATAAMINLYPNPSTQYIHVEADEAIREVVIYNALGQRVNRINNLGNKGTINLGAYNNGTYTMRIVLENGNTATRKFIISK